MKREALDERTVSGQLSGGGCEAIDWRAYDAVLFDLDGVITQSARLHAKAWKALFDRCLETLAALSGGPCELFDIDRDYTRYVDGRPRLEGIRTFLASRAITIPEGEPCDSSDMLTVSGLARSKNEHFQQLIREHGVDVHHDAVALLDYLENIGCRGALITSSQNCDAILAAAGMEGRFDVRVDGLIAKDRGLPGKPAPDTFLEAARRLELPPKRIIVIEDSIAGVAAGRAGDFGLVVGVDRGNRAGELRANGADVVTRDLRRLIGCNETAVGQGSIT